MFCGDAEPLFDSYWPLSRSGRRVAFLFRLSAAIKRAIKQNATLWSFVCAARRWRGRLSGA